VPGFHAGRLEGPGAARNGAQTDEDGVLRFISIGIFGIYWDLSVVFISWGFLI